jgi:PAS domain S-box-containing protein
VDPNKLRLAAWLDANGGAKVVAILAELLPHAAVYLVDEARNIILWSRGAEALLGFGAHEVLGQACLKSERRDDCLRTTPATDARTVSDEPLTLYHKDGSAIAVRKTARALFDPDGHFRGSIEVVVGDNIQLPGSGEASRMTRALAEHGGHIGRAAASLGMSRPTFWRKRKKHGI